MPLLTAKQQIAIKQEATAGSVQALIAANVVLHTGVATWTPDIIMTPRDAMTASLSKRGSVSGAAKATIKFKMFLRGTSTAPVVTTNEPDFSVPFKGCGANITVSGGSPNEQSSFKPSTALVSLENSGAYCTVALYEDGKRYQIIGAVGNCVISWTAGQPVVADFEFTGIYTQPTTTSLLVPTYPTVISPAFKSGAFTVIDGTTPKISSLTLDFGNTVSMREDPTASTGYATAQITSRSPRGTLDPEDTLIASGNPPADLMNGTTGSITITWGTANYNNFALTIPKAQYTKVDHGDRNGIATCPLEYECVANSDAGNDEWELVQT